MGRIDTLNPVQVCDWATDRKQKNRYLPINGAGDILPWKPSDLVLVKSKEPVGSHPTKEVRSRCVTSLLILMSTRELWNKHLKCEIEAWIKSFFFGMGFVDQRLSSFNLTVIMWFANFNNNWRPIQSTVSILFVGIYLVGKIQFLTPTEKIETAT